MIFSLTFVFMLISDFNLQGVQAGCISQDTTPHSQKNTRSDGDQTDTPIKPDNDGLGNGITSTDPSLFCVESSKPPSNLESYSGDYLNYNIQPGDNLQGLAGRFQTSAGDLLYANPSIAGDSTTLQPGEVVRIPAQSVDTSKTIFQILPDSAFIDGPSQSDFNTADFVKQHPGWLASYTGFDGTTNRSGSEIVDLAVRDYHVSPRLLLALLEYESGALTNPNPDKNALLFPMGYENMRHKNLYNQVMVISNWLNDGYYSWRSGDIKPLLYDNGEEVSIDPRLDAASAALVSLFFQLETKEDFQKAISAEGFWSTYKSLFGDAWENEKPHIPANLQQPHFDLPFLPGKAWAFTGGPHTVWGDSGQPWAALDFAPPSLLFGCVVSNEWTTAVASGLIIRADNGMVSLDLDGDGDRRTGWVVYYFHVAEKDRVKVGTSVNAGDLIGHPSCEGGHATGSHIHIARQYNGEWISAYGAVPFNMQGWTAHRGKGAYQGTLTRQTDIIYANTNANDKTLIMNDVQLSSNG